MLREHLELVANFRRTMAVAPGVKFTCPEELVLAHGRTPSVKHKAPWEGEPKNCFNNAASYVLGAGKGFYTEGYFASVIPIHHAWVTLPDGSIFDPTLDDERGPEHYLGIAFDTRWYRSYLKRNDNMPSVFESPRGMYNLSLLRGDFKLATLSPS